MIRSESGRRIQSHQTSCTKSNDVIFHCVAASIQMFFGQRYIFFAIWIEDIEELVTLWQYFVVSLYAHDLYIDWKLSLNLLPIPTFCNVIPVRSAQRDHDHAAREQDEDSAQLATNVNTQCIV
ncbi:hypothetical protein HZU67_05762 [Apis mellifera carnica]|nr:hypothetical protein HZU67_05762 [Apis mellifera carnica]